MRCAFSNVYLSLQPVLELKDSGLKLCLLPTCFNLFQFDLTCLDSVHFSLNQMTQNSDWSRRFLVQSRWLLASCFLRGINWRAAAKIAPHCNFLSLFHFQLVPNCSSVIPRKYSLALHKRCVWFLPTSYIWLTKRSGAVAYIWYVRRLQDLQRVVKTCWGVQIWEGLVHSLTHKTLWGCRIHLICEPAARYSWGGPDMLTRLGRVGA